jgi:hypothetical protein
MLEIVIIIAIFLNISTAAKPATISDAAIVGYKYDS